MGIKVDWPEFRIRIGTLKAWVREWDDLFVIESPANEAEERLAYKKHETRIKELRAQIRSAGRSCKTMMMEAGAAEEMFGVGNTHSFIARLSLDDRKKAVAICDGYRAAYFAEVLVKESTRAANYSFVRWDLIHAKGRMKSVFVACREAIEGACWALSDIEDPRRREAAAREEADGLEVELPLATAAACPVIGPLPTRCSDTHGGDRAADMVETVSAVDLAKTFDASATTIRKRLIKDSNIAPVKEGTNGSSYRWEKQKAEAECAQWYTRKALP